DNGLGIKEEDQKKVFTPFFTTKISNRKGTGLGLYVIKKIITENHKGRIQVSSIYKQGTTFSLELTTADTAEHANNAPSKGNIEIWGE
ncbi:MAG: HAMP domain-containing sensor histidine kinase, partial [Candidatus Omnitrophota bacterium]